MPLCSFRNVDDKSIVQFFVNGFLLWQKVLLGVAAHWIFLHWNQIVQFLLLLKFDLVVLVEIELHSIVDHQVSWIVHHVFESKFSLCQLVFIQLMATRTHNNLPLPMIQWLVLERGLTVDFHELRFGLWRWLRLQVAVSPDEFVHVHVFFIFKNWLIRNVNTLKNGLVFVGAESGAEFFVEYPLSPHLHLDVRYRLELGRKPNVSRIVDYILEFLILVNITGFTFTV